MIEGLGGLTVFWTLAGNCSDVEKKSLAQEIELGKSLDGDKHPNIVNFLGCVSTSGNAFCLFWLRTKFVPAIERPGRWRSFSFWGNYRKHRVTAKRIGRVNNTKLKETMDPSPETMELSARMNEWSKRFWYARYLCSRLSIQIKAIWLITTCHYRCHFNSVKDLSEVLRQP